MEDDEMTPSLSTCTEQEVKDSLYRINEDGPGVSLFTPFLGHTSQAVEFYNDRDVTEDVKKIVKSGVYASPYVSPRAPYPFQPFLEWVSGPLRSSLIKLVNESDDLIEDESEILLLLVGTTGFNELLHLEYDAKDDDDKKECMSILWGSLEVDSVVINCISTGIIVSDPKLPNSVISICNGNLPAVAMLSLPHVLLEYVTEIIIMPSCLVWGKKLKFSLRWFEAILSASTGTDDVTGLVMWINGSADSGAADVVVENLNKFVEAHPNIAVAGGFVPRVYSKGTVDKNVVASGFVLRMKQPSLRVRCAAFKESFESVESKERLGKLALNKMQQKSSTGSFGIVMYSKEEEMCINVDELGTVFPKTQLIGMKCDRLFYNEVLENNPSQDDDNLQALSVVENGAVILYASY